MKPGQSQALDAGTMNDIFNRGTLDIGSANMGEGQYECGVYG